MPVFFINVFHTGKTSEDNFNVSVPMAYRAIKQLLLINKPAKPWILLNNKWQIKKENKPSKIV